MPDGALETAEIRSTDADEQPEVFYRQVLQTLDEAHVEHLVGGAYALAQYTGVPHDTKDFDVFLRRTDFDRATEALKSRGYRAEVVHPHFLGKVFHGPHFVDLIYGSGNGIVPVDDSWFEHTSPGSVFGVPVRFCSVEDALWSKAFIMERERFDGGDIAHVLLATAERLDWPRLLERFGPNWRVLLAHLVLFGFVYPGRQALIPRRVLDTLIERLRSDTPRPADLDLCRGGLLSRRQYLHDLNEMEMRDARLPPDGTMTPEEIDHWTEAGEETD
jgi:hypothetical protein